MQKPELVISRNSPPLLGCYLGQPSHGHVVGWSGEARAPGSHGKRGCWALVWRPQLIEVSTQGPTALQEEPPLYPLHRDGRPQGQQLQLSSPAPDPSQVGLQDPARPLPTTSFGRLWRSSKGVSKVLVSTFRITTSSRAMFLTFCRTNKKSSRSLVEHPQTDYCTHPSFPWEDRPTSASPCGRPGAGGFAFASSLPSHKALDPSPAHSAGREESSFAPFPPS